MKEKIYNTMTRTGAGNVVLGIVVLVTGVAAGVMMLICGVRLLKRRKDILI